MRDLIPDVVLHRSGPAEATVGLVSLPLPRGWEAVRVDAAQTGLLPVGWWERGTAPRRSIAYVLAADGMPETLRLTEAPAAAEPSAAWSLRVVPTITRAWFKPAPYRDIDSLRGIPAEDCATMQGQLELTYGGRTLVVQAGGTGPDGGVYYWENVQIDTLWANAVAQGVRVGGVIYNGDTYLWGDLYCVLFANGVADVTAHFYVSRLHIKGYDYQGMPLLRLAGEAVTPVAAAIPADGTRFTLGALALNLEAVTETCSVEQPARLEAVNGEAIFHPFARMINPQLRDAPPQEWQPGFGRTARFQLSLSGAAPVVARYVVPAWLYAAAGDPWPFADLLPVEGAAAGLAAHTLDEIRAKMERGTFAAGFEERSAWDGDVTTALLHLYYRTGRPELFADAILYAYHWADLFVDHTDYSVRQWGGGWGWKTCAYTKFRDLLFGYLETGDPYLRDAAEMSADVYWSWYRANWPRSSMGRDNFELGGMAMLWRYLDSPGAHDRTKELVRMNATVLQYKHGVGGQMGAGPHPGCRPALYMTGVAMLSLLDAAEAGLEKGDAALADQALWALRRLHVHFLTDDYELFPSDVGDGKQHGRATWPVQGHRLWGAPALRIYPELLRLTGDADADAQAGLAVALRHIDGPPKDWDDVGRLVMAYENPHYADAMLLGARLDGRGVHIAPLAQLPLAWLAEQHVATPWGVLTLRAVTEGETVTVTFAADRVFPVTLTVRGRTVTTTSQGSVTLQA